MTTRCPALQRVYRCFGTTIRLRATTAALLEAMIATLPPRATRVRASARPDVRLFLRGAGPCGCGQHHHRTILFLGARLHASGSLDALLDHCRQITKFRVAERARHVFVHAGVVAWRGRIILMPGRSGAGKTTLVMALVRAGATYYSDEYAVIDAAGLVHPFPQHLGVRDPGVALPRRVPVSALGWRAGTTPLPVGLVLLTSYRRSARWQARPLSRARAVFAVLPHAVQHATHPARVMSRLGTALSGALTVEARRGDVEAAVAFALGSLKAPRIVDFR